MKCLLCKNHEVEIIKDKLNPFTKFYKCPACGLLIMEPVYERKLELYAQMHGEDENYHKILNKMQELIKKNNYVTFVDDIETCFTNIDGLFIEFRDVLDLCDIPVNDISRGSDYGD